MTASNPANVAASVRQRLLNRSRKTGEDYNLLLTHYGIERLLYRLSLSEHTDRFVLKGAMLFTIWTGSIYRPTRDLDLLGLGDSSAEHLVEVFCSLCALDAKDDGLVFDDKSVRCEEIRGDQAYTGQRVKLTALLEKARIDLQVDIGFGDAVTPDAKRHSYPTLLDHPAPVIFSYPPETVVAEKLEAMVSLGMGNSRMKDFYDVWTLLQNFDLDENVMRDAIGATFKRRRTKCPATIPIAMSHEFASDPTKNRQWRAFIDRSGLSTDKGLSDVIDLMRQRLWPLLKGLG